MIPLDKLLPNEDPPPKLGVGSWVTHGDDVLLISYAVGTRVRATTLTGKCAGSRLADSVAVVNPGDINRSEIEHIIPGFKGWNCQLLTTKDEIIEALKECMT